MHKRTSREVGEAHMARPLALALTLVLCAFGGLVGDSRGQWSGPYAECVAAMDALHSAAWMDHHPRFEGTPLTVEMWVRLRSSTAYNILIAHEVKSSNAHWEIFTLPESGRLTAYLPGCTPDHVGSSYALTDGVWHYVCMVSEANSVALFVDGAEVARETVTRVVEPYIEPGPLFIGSLVAREFSCDGEIAEVRISAAARDVSAVPVGPMTADDRTLGLWQLGSEGDAIPNLGGPAGPAQRVPAIIGWDRLDITTLSAAESARLDVSQGEPTGDSHAPKPPTTDIPEIRRLLAAAAERLQLDTLESASRIREAVLADWEEQRVHLGSQVAGQTPLPGHVADQVFDAHALCSQEDGDALGVVLRRTEALLANPALSEVDPSLSADWSVLAATARAIPIDDAEARRSLYYAACALRRQIAFRNPLLDFGELLFVARGVYHGSRMTGATVTRDVYGQHFATQYYGFNSIPGGGLFAAGDLFADGPPTVRNLLERARVENGRLAGQPLTPGAFLSPDLSYDGSEILFAYTQNSEHEWVWSPETTFNLFRVRADGTGLRQLTDSPYNDFDPCWLPNGRVAFISERRGGYIRCFALLHVPSHVLHSMKPDGSDIYPLSYYETSEWHPSVDNDGMLVYTRWDYTDRENCLGSNFWISFPDGRDPRAPHGNYPYPWHTYPDNVLPDTRWTRPYTEMNIRAIPGSHKYILTAAPHHGESFGSLCILDLRVPDDGGMSQLRRFTPYALFPETELPGRSQYPYGTPWPLSEDFTLCNWWENLYLLDRYGNQELLVANSEVFGGETDWEMRLIDPIPLRPRPTPPAMPIATNQGEDARDDHPTATIRIMNVYDSDQPFPEGTEIRYLRVVQNILKTNPWMGLPMIGYQNENTPRIPLGIVPVEADGSVFFEAPVERELIFQVLDSDYRAVQSMRSVAFVHPGEQLSCQGCHEPRESAPTAALDPIAFRRAPSRLIPEVGPVEPVTYYRLVQPVFENSCVPCHQERGGPADMSYEALEPYAFYFAGGMSGSTIQPVHGGSRSIPGRFGARYSRMGQALFDENHVDAVSPEDRHKVILWLDCNSQRLGAYEDEEAQMAGELVWPSLDVDPGNPQGLEAPRSRVTARGD